MSKLIAQMVEKKLSEYDRKMLDGQIDLVLFFDAATQASVILGKIIPPEDREEVNRLWRNFKWDMLDKAIRKIPKPEIKDDLPGYIKKVLARYNDDAKNAEMRLIEYVEKYHPIVTEFLQPFREERKEEAEIETIGFNYISR